MYEMEAVPQSCVLQAQIDLSAALYNFRGMGKVYYGYML